MDVEPLSRVFVTTYDNEADKERTVAGLVTSYEPTDDGFNITATLFPRDGAPTYYEGPVWETRDDAEENSAGHPQLCYLEAPAAPEKKPARRARKVAPKAGDSQE